MVAALSCFAPRALWDGQSRLRGFASSILLLLCLDTVRGSPLTKIASLAGSDDSGLSSADYKELTENWKVEFTFRFRWGPSTPVWKLELEGL